MPKGTLMAAAGAILTVSLAMPAAAGLDWEKHVKLDPALLRPAEVDHLIGDSSKARQQLDWSPTIDFPGLIRMMVDADVARLASKAKGTR